MMIKGAKTIAEYAIRNWAEANFFTEGFTLEIAGNRGILTDRNGDSLMVTYDNITRTIYVD